MRLRGARDLLAGARRLDGSIIAMIAFVLVAACVLLRPQFLSASDDTTLVASAYNDLVADMVEAKLIVTPPEAIAGDEGDVSVGLSETALNTEAIRNFVFNSNLRSDLLATDDRWKFLNGSLIGIDPRIHNLRDPFVEPNRWLGAVHYARTSQETKTVVQVTSTGEFETLLESGLDDSGETYLVDVFGSTKGQTTSNRIRFAYMRDSTAPATIAEMILAQDTVLLSIRCRTTAPVRIGLISAALPIQPCAENDDVGAPVFVLRPGDGISFADATRERDGTIFTVGVPGGGLSRWGAFTDRVTDTTQVSGLVVGIAEAMNQFVVGNDLGQAGNGSDEDDLYLSLRADLQKRLDASFPAYLEGYRTATRSPDPIAGAVAVVDAYTGEIIGLGSQEPSSGSNLLAFRHQAFVPMSAGSTAKVPVSAAILAQHPALRFLCAPRTPFSTEPGERAVFDRVLGAKLESGAIDLLAGDPTSQLVNFEEYLQRSSNRYAATLLMLASTQARVSNSSRFEAVTDQSAGRLPADDQYGFASSTAGPCGNITRVSAPPSFLFDFRPDTITAEGARQLWIGGNTSSTLGAGNWTFNLANMFDMPRVAPLGQGVSQTEFDQGAFDTSVWRSLRSNEENLAYFSSVSPAHEDFALDWIDNIRAQYLTVILGGGQARWTTVKLAQSYARIVADKDAPLTLIDRGSEPVSRGKAMDLLDAESRQALLRGMRKVVAGGTASRLLGLERALNANAREGEKFRIFAKTGTPSRGRPERSPMNSLANSLIEAGVIVRIAPETIGVASRPDEDEIAALKRGYREIAQGSRLSDSRARSLLSWIRRTNARIRSGQGRSLIRFAADGSITLGMDDFEAVGAGELNESGVLALVITRSCGEERFEEDPDWRPSAALGMAINIASRARRADGRSGSNPGILFLAEHELLSARSPIISALRAPERQNGSCRVM